MRVWFVVALLAGCYQPQREEACLVSCTMESGCPQGLPCVNGRCGEGCDDSGLPAADASPDAPPGCVGQGDLIFCPKLNPFPSLILSGMFDTTADGRCEAVTSTAFTACVLVATDLTIGNLTVVGTRPLVLVTSQLTIPFNITVDASGHNAVGGAGHRTCASGDGKPGTGGRGGGGAGGSFGGVGGQGGAGQAAAGGNPIAGAGLGVYGGCDGGRGVSSLADGAGGAGGGVIVLVGTEGVALNGNVLASGGGGTTGDGGGGGGGSGGSIVVISPLLTGSTGKLFAIGGGGAGGSNTSPAGDGGEATTTGLAPGGAGGGIGGGAGGPGHVGITYGGAGFAGPSAGGGGGGGGVGRISLRVATSTNITTIDPPAM